MSKTPSALAKPKSIWIRKMKVDLKPLLKAATKAATHIATLKFEELGNDAVEVATSIGVETPVEELAYRLIQRSLLDAITDLSTESISHFFVADHEKNFYEALEAKLLAVEFEFGEDFFKAPQEQPLIKEIVVIYKEWLCQLGVAPKSAETIAARLPTYFLFSLGSEWKRNSEHYKRLLESSKSPFIDAEKTLRGWQHYFAYLKKRVSENVFDEPFSLRQIYVPLNAFYIDKKSAEQKDDFRSSDKKVCVDLARELFLWLKKSDKDDALRVISGGPGSGKSSFTRIFCCDVAESGVAKPIYIPLHLIDPTRDVVGEVERFVRDEGLIGFNPLEADRQESNVLIVFDGLDELASMGKVAAQVARDFIQAVERLIERRNLGASPIFVLFSGRELIIQENETEFRRPKQVLNLLPYFVTEEKASFDDPNSLLDVDLRDKWWKNYGQLLGESFDGVPKNLKIKEIDEVTAQPLLNYLVALSFRRGKLDFTRDLNLNSVYFDLVAAVHERGYEKTRTYRPIGHVAQKDFVRVLEEIGLAAWHGADGRSTSVKDILVHCKQSGLETMLQSFTEGAQAGVTKLLAAFFFRRHGEQVGEDATFVFTHKSFGEYLSAARLVRGLDRIVIDRNRRRDNPDDGQDIPDALISWMKIAGPASLTENIHLFLKREIAQRNIKQLELWQDILNELVSYSIENSVPMEKIGNLNFSTCCRHEINGITSLFVALNAISIALKKAVKIRFSTETAFGTFLRRMCPQRPGAVSPLLFNALSYIDLSGQCLDMADLYRADLSHSKLRGCRLHFANLDGAVLVGTDFSGAILSWSRMLYATLSKSIFFEARLNQVRFGDHAYYSGTLISEVNFVRADISETNFENCSLFGCDFEEAKLFDSNLFKTKSIEQCKFDGGKVLKQDKALSRWFEKLVAAGKANGSLKEVPDNRV